MNNLEAQSELLRLCEQSPRLGLYLSAMQSGFYRVNFQFIVPNVSGISKAGTTIYIDRGFNPMMGPIDITSALAAYEYTLWSLCNFQSLGVRVDLLDLALSAERLVVERLFLDRPADEAWTKYCEFIEGQSLSLPHDLWSL